MSSTKTESMWCTAKFLHPPPYSYRRGSCFLYSSCSMPMPNQLQGETHTTHPVIQRCVPGCCRHMTTGLQTGWTWSYLPTCWSYSTASETHSRPPAETPSVCNVNKIHLILSQSQSKQMEKHHQTVSQVWWSGKIHRHLTLSNISGKNHRLILNWTILWLLQ